MRIAVCLIVGLFWAELVLGALRPYELHVKFDRDPAVYAVGETAKVVVRITQDGNAVGGKTAVCSWNYENSNTVTRSRGLSLRRLNCMVSQNVKMSFLATSKYKSLI